MLQLESEVLYEAKDQLGPKMGKLQALHRPVPYGAQNSTLGCCCGR